MEEHSLLSRRSSLKGIGAIGAMAVLGPQVQASETKSPPLPKRTSRAKDVREKIFAQVWQTPFVDTHEHLIEEKDRLSGTAHPRVKSDDWSMLFSHYLNSDLLTAGMPKEAYDKFFSPNIDPIDKWKLLEPYWPAVKNTGYGQATAIAIRDLYGVEQLSSKTIRQVQAGYERIRRPGFYAQVLGDAANIESCQVNCLARPFEESLMPTLLMQDLSIVGMFSGPSFDTFGAPTGLKVATLSDWHRVIDWWFGKYAAYAVAVKSQNAYSRDIDYEQVPAEKVEAVFGKRLQGETLMDSEKKALEDHLFWYAVNKAAENKLPVKLHTGYYAGQNGMPLSRLIKNPGSACELCKAAPQTPFVFMHICYPYYEELISVAKHYTNAHLDMCWAWIINPIAAKDFLKKYLLTAPANKILTFGGDYVPVEPVLGHATIARQGIALALTELVEEGWLSLDTALELIEPIMRGNAHRIFNLEQKTKLLEQVKWS